jgi:hypothetical protein
MPAASSGVISNSFQCCISGSANSTSVRSSLLSVWASIRWAFSLMVCAFMPFNA